MLTKTQKHHLQAVIFCVKPNIQIKYDMIDAQQAQVWLDHYGRTGAGGLF